MSKTAVATQQATVSASPQGPPTTAEVAAPTPARPGPGKPQEQLEVQDEAEAGDTGDNNVVYPKGTKLWLIIVSIMLTCVVYGLDLTIITAAVPSLTNQFKSINDIGWYSAAYGLVGSALTFFWARSYTLFPVKSVYIISIFVFELGALVCTVAPSSTIFILGRALSGCGGAGIANGSFTIMTHAFPNDRRPMWMGITNVVQTVTMVAAPLIGGGLIDAFSWRACFGLNLPLGATALVLVWFGFNSPIINPDESLPWRQKIKKLDPISTLIFMPAIICLLLALQWGGMTYGWSNPRIITLLVTFGVLFLSFAYLQYRFQEDAILPLRILKNRNILGAAWFEACCDGTLAVTEYYFSIFFQGVRGFSAFKSGYLGVPMIVGLCVSALLAGFGTTYIGYYTPFMYITSILGPVASGLLTTLDLETDLTKVLVLLGFIGVVVGFGISAPSSAVPTVLAIKDVPVGVGIVGFGARLGQALFISVSATLFRNRLVDEVSRVAPEMNATILETAGLSDIRNIIGEQKLRDVMLGYGEAVSQTLYLPVGLMVASLLGTLAVEWRSVKKKTE